MPTNNFSYDKDDNWNYKPQKDDDGLGCISGLLFIAFVVIVILLYM